MSANKVILNGNVLIDLTEDTVVENGVRQGKTFHKANGEPAVGTSSGLDINGIVKQYKVNAGASVSAGDFVEFVTKYGSGEFSASSVIYISACKLDENRVLVAYRDVGQSGRGEVVLLSFDGNMVSIGAPTIFAENSSYVSILTLLSDTAIIIYKEYSEFKACLIAINGTIINTGNAVTISTGAFVDINATRLSNSKVLVTYAESVTSTGSTLSISARVITINNENIAVGNSNSIVFSYSEPSHSLASLSENKAIISYPKYDNNTWRMYVCALMIEEETVTSGSSYVVPEASSGNYANTLVPLSYNKAFLIHDYVQSSSSPSHRVELLSIDGTTVNFLGGLQESQHVLYAAGTAISESVAIVFITTRPRIGEDRRFEARALSFGNTISSLHSVSLASNEVRSISAVPMGNNSATVFCNNNGASEYIQVTYTDGRLTKNASGDAGTFVQPATSNLFNVGVAKTSGTAGETVDVYCVE